MPNDKPVKITKTEIELRRLHESGAFDKAATLAIHVYGPGLYGFALNFVKNEDVASDIFAEVSMQIWTRIEKFRWESTFRTWIYTITRNICFHWLKEENKWDVKQLEAIPVLSRLVARMRTRTLPFLKTEIKNEIRQLRNQLTPEEQALLTLRIDKKMSWNEVVEVFHGDGSSPLPKEDIERLVATRRKQFERIKKKLRELVEKAGLLGDD